MPKFDDLSLDDRANIVWSGNFIDKTPYFGFVLHLYAIQDAQWAEIWFDAKELQIMDVKLVEEKEFEKWLSRINLEL
jgi:hypothetical protein